VTTPFGYAIFSLGGLRRSTRFFSQAATLAVFSAMFCVRMNTNISFSFRLSLTIFSQTRKLACEMTTTSSFSALRTGLLLVCFAVHLAAQSGPPPVPPLPVHALAAYPLDAPPWNDWFGEPAKGFTNLNVVGGGMITAEQP
jgi:hypothetical protein